LELVPKSVFIIILYEDVFQNPAILPTQVSLSTEQSTLAPCKPLIGIPNFYMKQNVLFCKSRADDLDSWVAEKTSTAM
jgi:hypothetical protein